MYFSFATEYKTQYVTVTPTEKLSSSELYYFLLIYYSWLIYLFLKYHGTFTDTLVFLLIFDSIFLLRLDVNEYFASSSKFHFMFLTNVVKYVDCTSKILM